MCLLAIVWIDKQNSEDQADRNNWSNQSTWYVDVHQGKAKYEPRPGNFSCSQYERPASNAGYEGEA